MNPKEALLPLVYQPSDETSSVAMPLPLDKPLARDRQPEASLVASNLATSSAGKSHRRRTCHPQYFGALAWSLPCPRISEGAGGPILVVQILKTASEFGDR